VECDRGCAGPAIVLVHLDLGNPLLREQVVAAAVDIWSDLTCRPAVGFQRACGPRPSPLFPLLLSATRRSLASVAWRGLLSAMLPSAEPICRSAPCEGLVSRGAIRGVERDKGAETGRALSARPSPPAMGKGLPECNASTEPAQSTLATGVPQSARRGPDWLHGKPDLRLAAWVEAGRCRRPQAPRRHPRARSHPQ
jgi:hypothetical protein